MAVSLTKMASGLLVVADCCRTAVVGSDAVAVVDTAAAAYVVENVDAEEAGLDNQDDGNLDADWDDDGSPDRVSSLES